jgi:hypothetical protein
MSSSITRTVGRPPGVEVALVIELPCGLRIRYRLRVRSRYWTLVLPVQTSPLNQSAVQQSVFQTPPAGYGLIR